MISLFVALLLAPLAVTHAAEPPQPASSSVVERTRDFATTGNWSFSTLMGYETDNSTIHSSDPKATATWTPHQQSVGPVRLSLFLVTHEGNSPAALVEVFSGGKINTIPVNMQAGEPRWLSLGEFEFGGKGEEFVRVQRGAQGTVRLSALKLEILDATDGSLWQTIVLDDLATHDLSKLQQAAPLPLRIGPPNPDQWELTFSDDFNGDQLDTTVWKSAQGLTSKKLRSARFPENAVVKDGLLHLVTRKENRGGKQWTSAMISTKAFRQKYGYWESRYRYAAATGLNQAFWMHTDTKDKSQVFEIDVNEGHYPNYVNTTLHQAEMPSKSKRFVADYDLSAGFHIYAAEWNEHEVIYYFDGREIHRAPNTKAHLEIPVIYSTAVLPWAGPITDALDGKSMDVDWVRVYRAKSTSPSAAAEIPCNEPTQRR